MFALEHGIARDELAYLEEKIRAHITQKAPSNDHWLPWVIYAAEIGYRYSGDEYWQTFETETPGWTKNGKRDWIRNRFQQFHETYGGAKPSGPWAEHFTIICWPITHSILPKDLQRQLASILFSLSKSSNSSLSDSPEQLGLRIAAESWNASSRFQKLTEQPLLVGQIAAALLNQDASESRNSILPTTLLRIAEDLERERRSRFWLRSARRTAAKQTRLRGLRSSFEPTSGEGSRISSELSERIAIEPKLVLYPVGDDRWQVLAEFPDFSPLLAWLPASKSVLTESRCFVSGSSGSPLWRGRLLYGSQQGVKLGEWPSLSQPMLRFEDSNEEMDDLLAARCRLTPGPTWLFRIMEDGLASELRTRVVRPGNSYLLLSDQTTLESLRFSKRIKVECEGIYAARIDLPDSFSDEWLEDLQAVGVTHARTLEVWPAGLPPVSWDGEGGSEWLTTDEICLGVRADYPIESLALSMSDGGVLLEVQPACPGHTTFVNIGLLPAGCHRFQISARTRENTDLPKSDGSLQLTVREPKPWLSGVIPQGPLMVHLDPPFPNLEDLWESRLSVEVHGPSGSHARCKVAFFDRDSLKPRIKKTLPRLSLPVNEELWRQTFKKVLDDEKVRAEYDFIQHCTVEISANELGRYEFKVERDFTPLRWAISRSGSIRQLELLDDRGVDDPIEIEFFAFGKPDQPISLPPSDTVFTATPLGGMYVARSGATAKAVILPVKRLESLKLESSTRARTRSPREIAAILSYASLWSEARLSGHTLIASMGRAGALLALLRRIFSLLGGESWVRAEAELNRKKNLASLKELKRAISKKSREAALGATLLLEFEDHIGMSPHDRVVRLGELVNKFLNVPTSSHGGSSDCLPPRTGDPAWLAELALRIASGSAGTEHWAGDDLLEGLSTMLEYPAIARSARFLVLGMETSRQDPTRSTQALYQGWDW